MLVCDDVIDACPYRKVTKFVTSAREVDQQRLNEKAQQFLTAVKPVMEDIGRENTPVLMPIIVGLVMSCTAEEPTT